MSAKRMTVSIRSLLSFAAGAVLILGAGGCALRATTDFGPQSSSSRQSINAGPEGLPGVPVLGGNSGDAPGARSGGYSPEIGGSPFSSEGGAAGSAGGR